MQIARNRLAMANGARLSASAIYTAHRGDIEHELTQSASPLIAQFIEWARDEVIATRKKFSSRSWDEHHQITGKRYPKSENNSAAVNARIAALNAAIEAANDMRLIADQSHVAAALETLKRSLPKVEGA
ncbi:MAG: hypothetical protein WA733_12455 [Methylocystis sp.]